MKALLQRGGLGSLLLLVLALSVVLACRHQPVRFAHTQHLGLACGPGTQVECLTCTSCHHEMAQGSTSPGHPSGQKCEECHDENQKKVQASLHAPRTSAHELAAQISFNHEKHLKMSKIGGQCISCHSGVVSETTEAPFPPMSRCFECHEHQEQWNKGTCVPCHQQKDLKTLFPRTFLRHGPGWDKVHGAAATESVAQCANCHSSESCDDCHDMNQGLQVEMRRAGQVEKDFTHPADFLTRHAMEAASEPATCLTCHRSEGCDSCHLAHGVSAARMGAVNPHPPGWTGPDSSATNHHGRAARRDILSCASCHDQGAQTNCIQCHQVGGPGGNPHPSGWKSSRTPSDVMCNYCHMGGP